ncbi:hypothetical protein CTI14_51245 [Methylobacterium radiotolerans]|nr:hypothetical protein CTI14_51245 [Methylobacterium radiotolerans]
MKLRCKQVAAAAFLCLSATATPATSLPTGTPAGVGQGLNPPQFLKSGDTVRIEIDGIGRIENRFV